MSPSAPAPRAPATPIAAARVCATCGAELAPAPVVVLHCVCGADLSAPEAVVDVAVAVTPGGAGAGLTFSAELGAARPRPKKR